MGAGWHHLPVCPLPQEDPESQSPPPCKNCECNTYPSSYIHTLYGCTCIIINLHCSFNEIRCIQLQCVFADCIFSALVHCQVQSKLRLMLAGSRKIIAHNIILILCRLVSSSQHYNVLCIYYTCLCIIIM